MGTLECQDALQLIIDLMNNFPRNNSLKKNYLEEWAVECQVDSHFANCL